MTYQLPLDKMSLDEKLETMESIWQDLCKSEKQVTSPEWHNDVLSERETRVQDGDEQFVSWVKAKKDIKNNL